MSDVLGFLERLRVRLFRSVFPQRYCGEEWCDVCPARLVCRLYEEAVALSVVRAWDRLVFHSGEDFDKHCWWNQCQ